MKYKIQGLVLPLLLIALPVCAAPVYKCTTPDGQTIFSNAGCGAISGTAEIPEIKINRIGALADPYEIQRERQNQAYERSKRTQVTVIKDSSINDKTSVDAHIRRRLNHTEEVIERIRPPDPSGVNVISDHSKADSETNRQKAIRLRTEAVELGY